MVIPGWDPCPVNYNPCQHNGICVRSGQAIQCICHYGFAGNLCQCEREDFFTPDKNYEIFILKWIKMKDKAKAFSMNSNKLMYFAFLLKLKPE